MGWGSNWGLGPWGGTPGEVPRVEIVPDFGVRDYILAKDGFNDFGKTVISSAQFTFLGTVVATSDGETVTVETWPLPAQELVPAYGQEILVAVLDRPMVEDVAREIEYRQGELFDIGGDQFEFVPTTYRPLPADGRVILEHTHFQLRERVTVPDKRDWEFVSYMLRRVHR